MLKPWFLLFSILSSIIISTGTPPDRPTVTTPLGQIRGYHKKWAKDKIFAAFEGVPYAKPPIENRRFEPPEPVEPWKGAWDATTVTECAQTGLIQTGVPQGEEDCLYVNVYVPREHPDPAEKLDVVVHIHGGLFMYGSGHGYSHPEYFMDQNVIFVNFNYRLGMLGFLSTGDSVVSGNNGLKDQVMALQWVQQNIASFGGNPESVTLTGLSAGASSVHYHYLSKMSVGLFHRGFSQSGVALNSFALQDQPLAKSKLLAEAVGCSTASTSVLVQCLKQRPFRHLLTKMPKFFGYNFLPVAPFGPVLEKGPKPFMTKNPYFLLATGKVQDLPWMTSTVTHEGLFPGAFIGKDLENINANWSQLAPSLLDYRDTLGEPLWEDTAQKLREYYVDNGDFNQDNFNKLIDMLSDRFLVDVEAAIKLQSRVNKSPVYYYQFGYSTNANKTVAHGEDAQYFFYGMFNRKLSPDEQKIKDILIDLLISFIRTGAPKIDKIEWTPVEFPEIGYVNLSDDIKFETRNEIAPRDFWKSLGFLENQNLVLMKDEL